MTDTADESHPTARWCAAADLIWTHYPDGEEWVVYNPASADIHLLTASAYQLWRLIATRQALSSEELAAKLAFELARPLDTELTTVTRNTLGLMDDAGLVRRVSP